MGRQDLSPVYMDAAGTPTRFQCSNDDMNVSQITRRGLFGVASGVAAQLWAGVSKDSAGVNLRRVPEGALQPQIAVDESGGVHLVYFRGDDMAGDLFYARSRDGGENFSTPLRANSHSGSAIAAGNIRGAHIALGRRGRVHVAWNGSKDAEPKGPSGQNPMLYTRLTESGEKFEPERNLIRSAYGLDGGGALAASQDGSIYVFWHAPELGEKGEDHRRIWVSQSRDDGATFSGETIASTKPTGACGCCGMGAIADQHGNVYALYRSAFETVHRDMYLLSSKDRGQTFGQKLVDPWQVGYCVMSTQAFAAGADDVLTAWETQGQVYFGRIDSKSGNVAQPIPAPGVANGRKHPVLATNHSGETLLAWTEGMSWKKGGSLAWQVFDQNGRLKAEKGEAPGVPAFSLIAAYARRDGGFTIVY